MFSKQINAVANTARRVIPSLGLAAAVLTSMLGAPVPASAEGPIVHDHRKGGPPSARVQVVLNSVRILDDRDWGDGEMDFYFQLTCFQLSTPCIGGYGSAHMTGYSKSFSVGSGETYPFDLSLSEAGQPNEDYDASAEGGLPLRAGHRYRLDWGMNEKDQLTNYDKMGEGEIDLTEENGWGIGHHHLKSDLGYYEIDFDVIRAPLPDVRPVNIKVTDLPGGTKQRACVAVQNVGLAVAGPFEVALRSNEGTPSDARTTVPGLTSGNSTEACVGTQLTAGKQVLEAYVDGPNALLEYNEANNRYEQDYAAPARQAATPGQADPATSKTVAGSTASDQGGLSISAIKVNGQVPDGKTDCKDGKNAVSVVVKNAGADKRGAFAVQLKADGEQVAERAVSGLEAGQMREVRFDEVRLNKGQHKLTASVDTKNGAAAPDADDTVLEVTAVCGA